MGGTSKIKTYRRIPVNLLQNLNTGFDEWHTLHNYVQLHLLAYYFGQKYIGMYTHFFP